MFTLRALLAAGFAKIAVLSAAWAVQVPGEKCPELERLAQARAALRTGRIVWCTRYFGPRRPEDEQVVYRWHSFDTPRYFLSQFTPGEYLVEDRGDPRGVVWPQADGTPTPDLGYAPMRYLRCDGKEWQRREGTLSAEVHEGGASLVDIRSLGLGSGLICSTPAQVLGRLARDAEMSVRDVEWMREVVVKRPGAARQVRLLLDPDRDWNPRRVTELERGEVVREVRSELSKFGDVWFPSRVEIYDRQHVGGSEPLYVIEVLDASFNEPDHPQRLTPESIGIEVGTNIDLYPAGSLHPLPEVFGWDGSKLVPLKEVFERIRSGELRRGPAVERIVNYWGAVGAGLGELESEWERYVREFIERYRLDDDQRERAWRILADCQERARNYLSRHQEQIEEIRAEARGIGYGNAATHPAAKQDRIAELRQRMLRLRQPLERIFFEQLVPRLEKIPTRAQREAVAQREQAARQPRSSAVTQPVEPGNRP